MAGILVYDNEIKTLKNEISEIESMKKNKRIRIKNTKDLNETVHNRDKNMCIICGEYVDIGEKWHHEPCGIGKEDIKEKGALLCKKCHHERHFGKLSRIIKEKIEQYLMRLYPEYWEGKGWK